VNFGESEEAVSSFSTNVILKIHKSKCLSCVGAST